MEEKVDKYILQAIDIIVKQRIKETLPIDWYEGIIRQKNSDGTYNVESANAILTVHKINDDSYSVGDVVIVLILKTQRYILSKKDDIVI